MIKHRLFILWWNVKKKSIHFKRNYNNIFKIKLLLFGLDFSFQYTHWQSQVCVSSKYESVRWHLFPVPMTQKNDDHSQNLEEVYKPCTGRRIEALWIGWHVGR